VWSACYILVEGNTVLCSILSKHGAVYLHYATLLHAYTAVVPFHVFVLQADVQGIMGVLFFAVLNQAMLGTIGVLQTFPLGTHSVHCIPHKGLHYVCCTEV
jgi:hypothetical protein